MAKKYDTVPDWATHGLITTYRAYGCRCQDCSDVNRAAKRKHYERNRERVLAQQKAARDAKPKPERPTVVDRFWQCVDRQMDDQCWLWTGTNTGTGKNKGTGYGQLWADGAYVLAHRLSAMIHFGMFDRRAVICHTCDVPRCVNPKHLYVGTHQTNAHDRQARGRGCVRDSGHRSTKLTAEQVADICRRYVRASGGVGGNARALSQEYGITLHYVAELVRKEQSRGNASLAN